MTEVMMVSDKRYTGHAIHTSTPTHSTTSWLPTHSGLGKRKVQDPVFLRPHDLTTSNIFIRNVTQKVYIYKYT